MLLSNVLDATDSVRPTAGGVSLIAIDPEAIGDDGSIPAIEVELGIELPDGVDE